MDSEKKTEETAKPDETIGSSLGNALVEDDEFVAEFLTVDKTLLTKDNLAKCFKDLPETAKEDEIVKAVEAMTKYRFCMFKKIDESLRLAGILQMASAMVESTLVKAVKMMEKENDPKVRGEIVKEALYASSMIHNEAVRIVEEHGIETCVISKKQIEKCNACGKCAKKPLWEVEKTMRNCREGKIDTSNAVCTDDEPIYVTPPTELRG